ncbi:MAG TPA: copper amine oxidase N-terminal domain-containing protein [Candidatus Baltobacteraceae bacterium]|nr:copper amine oxidase N-terminal domain-containing protein [Candidatus Baltobacteraceae bacterium]
MRYRKPSKTTIVATIVLAFLASLTFAYSKPVEMRVDGQPLISDVPPVTTPKGVFVPLRPVGDALGAETRYEHKSGDVVITRGDQTLHLKVGSTHAKINGMPVTFKHAPFRVRGRVMVSLHAVQQVFGVRVKFNKMTARVDLNTPGVSEASAEFQTQ